MLARSTEQLAIMVVIQFPPRLSRRTDVIIELRYGMCWRRLSDNAIITWTKYVITYTSYYIHCI